MIEGSVFIQPLGIVWPAAALAAVQLQWLDSGGGLGRLPKPAAVCWMWQEGMMSRGQLKMAKREGKAQARVAQSQFFLVQHVIHNVGDIIRLIFSSFFHQFSSTLCRATSPPAHFLPVHCTTLHHPGIRWQPNFTPYFLKENIFQEQNHSLSSRFQEPKGSRFKSSQVFPSPQN